MTLLQDSAPFSHMESDGSFNGILPDLLKRIEGLSGLKFTFVPVHSQTEALQAICDGKADIIGRLATDVFFAERNNLRLTRPYIDMPMTQIVHTGTSDIHKIVLQEASLKDIVAAGGADDSVQYKACADMERCFDTLANGQVDAMKEEFEYTILLDLQNNNRPYIRTREGIGKLLPSHSKSDITWVLATDMEMFEPSGENRISQNTMLDAITRNLQHADDISADEFANDFYDDDCA